MAETGGRVMDGFSRGTLAITAGYLLAFSVADLTGVVRASWVVPVIAVVGALGAAAGIRALPDTLRLLLGAASTGGFTMLGVIGVPVTAGLLVAAVLMGASSMSLFEKRQHEREARLET
jgi:hypothetical protein